MCAIYTTVSRTFLLPHHSIFVQCTDFGSSALEELNRVGGGRLVEILVDLMVLKKWLARVLLLLVGVFASALGNTSFFSSNLPLLFFWI